MPNLLSVTYDITNLEIIHLYIVQYQHILDENNLIKKNCCYQITF